MNFELRKILQLISASLFSVFKYISLIIPQSPDPQGIASFGFLQCAYNTVSVLIYSILTIALYIPEVVQLSVQWNNFVFLKLILTINPISLFSFKAAVPHCCETVIPLIVKYYKVQIQL